MMRAAPACRAGTAALPNGRETRRWLASTAVTVAPCVASSAKSGVVRPFCSSADRQRRQLRARRLDGDLERAGLADEAIGLVDGDARRRAAAGHQVGAASTAAASDEERRAASESRNDHTTVRSRTDESCGPNHFASGAALVTDAFDLEQFPLGLVAKVAQVNRFPTALRQLTGPLPPAKM